MAATMSQRFTFDLAPGFPVELEATLTLRPKNGLHVIAAETGDLMTGPDYETVIVGAGFSGIGAAIKLDKAGLGRLCRHRGRRRPRRHLVLEHVSRYRR